MNENFVKEKSLVVALRIVRLYKVLSGEVYSFKTDFA
jgi:hypothetical protein